MGQSKCAAVAADRLVMVCPDGVPDNSNHLMD